MTAIVLNAPQRTEAPVLSALPATEVAPMHASIRTATFDRMVRSKLNMRRKGGAAVGELAALIKAFGLLQNLVGFQYQKGGDATAPIEIVAGGRRLAAIGQLIAAGDLPDDYAIPYLLVTEQEAVALSLAENMGREAMHPADVVDCMRELVERGASPEDIAFSFGVDVLTVKRRLKLAHVSPRLFAMYSNDELCTEQMQAFAASDDHAAQEQAWDSLDPWSRKQPHAIRRLLLAQKINIASDRVARFVGRAAYEKAGGQVARDLFSESHEGYIQDAGLLERLAQDKLERLAAPMRAKGTLWTDMLVRVEPAALAEYGRVRQSRCLPTEAQSTELADLDAQMLALSAPGAADDTDGDDEEMEVAEEEARQKYSELRARRNKLEESLVQDLPGDVALAGVVVTIDPDGKAQVLKGMIRPADRCKMEKLGRQCAVAETGKGTKTRAVHSERLLQLLASHRTAALAAELSARPDIALVVLAHALARRMLGANGCESGFAQISFTRPMLADEAKAGAAGVNMQGKLAKWQARAREEQGDGSLFNWLGTLDRDALVELVALAVASSLDTALMGEKPTTAYRELAGALAFDMRRWWKPTAADYFVHLTKESIVDVVGSAVSKERAVPLAQLGKGACADAAEKAVADSGWLPAMFLHQ